MDFQSMKEAQQMKPMLYHSAKNGTNGTSPHAYLRKGRNASNCQIERREV